MGARAAGLAVFAAN